VHLAGPLAGLGGSNFGGITTDATNVYFITGDGTTGGIYKCAIAGCALSPTLVTSYTGTVAHVFITSVVVDTQYAYFALWDNGTTYIFRAAK